MGERRHVAISLEYERPLTWLTEVVQGDGEVDCWGHGGFDGELGNGQNNNSAIPVAVVSTSGSGTLGGVKAH